MDYDYRTDNGYYRGSSSENDEGRKSVFASLWNWQPKKDYLLLQLIRESSIHGVKYIAQPGRHITERLFWLITILICTGFSVNLGYNAIAKLFDCPVIISFQPSQSPITLVPFPSVTICNINRFRKSKFEAALRTFHNESMNETEDSKFIAQVVLTAMRNVCNTKKSLSVRYDYSLDETTVKFNKVVPLHLSRIDKHENPLTNVIQSCDDMIPLCLWEGVALNCSEAFESIVTDFGICCSFNLMPVLALTKTSKADPRVSNEGKAIPESTIKKWKEFNTTYGFLTKGEQIPEYDDDYPKHQSKAGQGSGLSVVLNPDLDEYFCTGHSSTGYRVYPNTPISWPHVADLGLAVPIDTEAFLNIEPVVTIAEEGVESLSVRQRQCYFLDEYQLEYYSYYTASNCIDECMSGLIYKKCQCFSFELLQLWKPNHNHTICTGLGYKCSKRIKQEINSEGTMEKCPHCLPSCVQVDYTTQTSSVPILDNVNIWKKDDETASWAGKNASIVHIFFGAETIYFRIRKKMFGYNQLFASVGGILGLFLGLSVMSVVEPFYFLIRLLYESWRLKSKTAPMTESRTSIITSSDGGHDKRKELQNLYFGEVLTQSPRRIGNHPPLLFLN